MKLEDDGRFRAMISRQPRMGQIILYSTEKSEDSTSNRDSSKPFHNGCGLKDGRESTVNSRMTSSMTSDICHLSVRYLLPGFMLV